MPKWLTTTLGAGRTRRAWLYASMSEQSQEEQPCRRAGSRVRRVDPKGSIQRGQTLHFALPPPGAWSSRTGFELVWLIAPDTAPPPPLRREGFKKSAFLQKKGRPQRRTPALAGKKRTRLIGRLPAGSEVHTTALMNPLLSRITVEPDKCGGAAGRITPRTSRLDS
jgi:hypothetical protein